MAPTRYLVTDIIIETPSYGGAGGRGGASSGVEHDIIGHGWAEIDNGSITIAVHPRGAFGLLEPKEKRTYALADITAWRATGESVTFGVGRIGLFATNGAEAPVHNCSMKCEDGNTAQQLTAQARDAGLAGGGGRPFHSGI
jgi:hypothetical protein